MKFTSGTNAPPSGSRAPVSVRWTKYRGPGAVTFDKARPELEKIAGAAPYNGKADATAKFCRAGRLRAARHRQRLLRRRRRRVRLLLDDVARQGVGQAVDRV